MAAVSLAEPEAAVAETLWEGLRRMPIRIPRPATVRDYLLRYPDLCELTRKVCELAAVEFAGKAELSLEQYEDRESDDTSLTLYVRQTPYDESVWHTIERLRASYADELANSLGFLHVTADFRASADR